jgi:hypothetical protein
VWLREHRHNLQQGLLKKSKLAQHACEEGHRVGWDDARVLETESNSRYRKYKESAGVIHHCQNPSESTIPHYVCIMGSNEASE